MVCDLNETALDINIPAVMLPQDAGLSLQNSLKSGEGRFFPFLIYNKILFASAGYWLKCIVNFLILQIMYQETSIVSLFFTQIFYTSSLQLQCSYILLSVLLLIPLKYFCGSWQLVQSFVHHIGQLGVLGKHQSSMTSC